jgi:plasmid segregation protein ParM
MEIGMADMAKNTEKSFLNDVDMRKGEKLPIVGIDDGYAQTKLYGGEVGAPASLCLVSSIRSGRYGLASMSGAGQVAAYRVEEGEEFTVSSSIPSEPTTFESYHVSTMNRVLVQHILLEAGFSSQAVDIMVGLPVADFFSNGRKDEARVARKVENLRKQVMPLDGREPVRYGRIRVGCQAIAAFVDWLLNDDLSTRNEAPARAAVVDVGGYTTDVAVILDGERIDETRTGTARIGMLDIYEMIAAGLRTRFQIQDRFPAEVLASALRTRAIRLWGREERVDNLVEHALVQHSAKVAREVERKLGGGADLDVILFVGGGANMLTSLIERFPNAKRVEQPELANARGLWKYARYYEDG